jgi:hypothetical protein
VSVTVPGRLKLLDPGRGQSTRLELASKLGDNVPSAGSGGAVERSDESILDAPRGGRFAWPNSDQLPRTYVNSRRVVRT